MRTQGTSKRVGLALVLALAVPLFAPTPAQAAGGGGWDCTPSSTQSGGVVTCNQGNGSNGGGGVAPDLSWTPITPAPGFGACTDQNGNASYVSYLYNAQLGQTIGPQCVTGFNNGGPGVDLKDLARTIVKMPTLKSDYTGKFLTGAEIKFSSSPQTFTNQGTPGVPDGALTAKPVKSDFKWDFGNGDTAKGTNVAYTYQSTVPNASNPDKHTVSVKVTGTWHLIFSPNPADPDTVQDLGDITLTGTLEPDPRTIVQVWSAQTEPN